MNCFARWTGLGLGAALVALPASAQTSAPAGHALATQYCARCHIVAPGGAGGWTNAPSFEAIANNPQANLGGLSAFIQRPYEKMLNTGRPANESEAIATYILSLRHK